MNKCDLPVTPVCVGWCACVCASQFNEWEPVTHQTAVLIVRSPGLKLRMSDAMSHTLATQTNHHSLFHTHTPTHTHTVSDGRQPSSTLRISNGSESGGRTVNYSVSN